MTADSAYSESSEPRLVAEDFAERWLRSPLGAAVARPWFDHAALWLLGRWFFPLSRLWAAARAANGSIPRFYDEVPMEPIPGIGARLRKTLDRFETAREAVNATEGRWRQVFFGEEGTELYRLVAIEAARRDRRNSYNATRRHFSYLRRRRPVPPVRWDVPGADEVEADYGPLLADPEAAFAPPDPFPEVFESQRVPGPAGEEYWLRFRSPSARMNDDVFARVYEPVGVADPPSLVFGHGICVEFDHWHGLADEVFALCRMGIRVIRPEAPWHGRRVPDGRYGGEMFIARAPRGALDTFSAQLLEWPVLIDWSRRTSRGPVAVGGSSLGALLAQLLAVKASAWPVPAAARRAVPDHPLRASRGRGDPRQHGGALGRRGGDRRCAAGPGNRRCAGCPCSIPGAVRPRWIPRTSSPCSAAATRSRRLRPAGR